MKTLYMILLLALGAFQLNAQIKPSVDIMDDEKPCVSFANVTQECQPDGTVDITFQVSNNARCESSGVTITTLGGQGQSYPISTGGQTVSNIPITHTGATPGSTLCFDVILHGGKFKVCCRSQVCVEVKNCDPNLCRGFEAEFAQYGGGCDASDQWAQVLLTGGTQPYSFCGSQNFYSPVPGNFIIFDLSFGSHLLVFKDANGCVLEVPVYIPPGDCSQFDIDLNPDNPSATITSQISATIGISLVGWCVPDRVEVFINGGFNPVLELIAGQSDCNGQHPDIQFGNSGTFCVEPCDVVEIVTTGNICPGQNEEDCPGATTWYDVYLSSCVFKDGGGEDFKSEVMTRSNVDRELAYSQKVMQLNAHQSVKVYPNPVTDVFTISNTDHEVDYKTARIINSAGQVMHTASMTNIDQLEINASGFSEGIYILEMTNDNGFKIVKKFIKLD